MVVMSRTPEPEPPKALGPIPQGHRRVLFTVTLALPGFGAAKDEIRDVLAAEAADLVTNGVAVMFDDMPEPEPEPVEEALELPKPYHSKPDWVAWAVAQGCDPEEAEGMTKNQLQNKYSERL